MTNQGDIDGAALVQIGNTSLSASTTVSATGLSSVDTIDIYGSLSTDAANQASLDISGAAVAAVTGVWTLAGDAMLQFGSGSVTTIDENSSLTMDGAEAQISDKGGLANSALSSLTSNYGTLSFHGDYGSYGGGPTVTTTVGFINAGTTNVDTSGNDGGTTLTIGGNFDNYGSLNIGNGNLTDVTAVNVALITNDGSITIDGDYYNNGERAILDDSGSAGFGSSGVVTGSVTLNGYSLIEFASGSITTIAAGASLAIQTGEGEGGYIADASATGSNSALTGLTSNFGSLALAYGAIIATKTGTAFANYATINIDNTDGTTGGSALKIGGVFSNDGTIYVGNGAESADGATSLSATELQNYGYMALGGNAAYPTVATVTGNVLNYGTLNINSNTTLNATGKDFIQDAGTTSVSGTANAAIFEADGGVLDFNSAVTSTGAMEIFSGGTIEFSGSASNAVAFKAPTGILELSSPSTFTGTITGFANSDVIDLVNTAVTGLTYSSGKLTVTGSGGTVATLQFGGTYTTASFVAVSDGRGGADIIKGPATQWNGSNADWSDSADWSKTPTSKLAEVLAGNTGYTVDRLHGHQRRLHRHHRPIRDACGERAGQDRHGGRKRRQQRRFQRRQQRRPGRFDRQDRRNAPQRRRQHPWQSDAGRQHDGDGGGLGR